MVDLRRLVGVRGGRLLSSAKPVRYDVISAVVLTGYGEQHAVWPDAYLVDALDAVNQAPYGPTRISLTRWMR